MSEQQPQGAHQDQAEQYVSIGRAARLLGCHQETLRRWAAAGKLPVYRTPGNQRRFKLADVRQVMAQ